MNVVDSVRNLFGISTSMRTIRDPYTHVNYDIVDGERCKSYHLTPGHPIDFREVQDLFINYPQFFYTEGKCEYLGEYNVQNVPCLVFEKEVENFHNQADIEEGDHENEEYLRYFHQNTNGVASNFTIVTHYYPNDPNYWKKDEFNKGNYTVPLKIEIRLFNEKERSNEIARLTINVATFKGDQAIPYELFDLSTCDGIQPDDYTRFRLKFDERSKQVERYRKYKKQIENAFRSLMDISPTR